MQREPRVIGAEVTDPTPFAVRVDLEFDEPMNMAQVPGDVNVEMASDLWTGWMAFIGWTDATHARYGAVMPWPPTWATVQLKVRDVHLKDMDGLICLLSEAITIFP